MHAACASAVQSALQQILARNASASFALILSGGVDTAAILEATSEAPADQMIPFASAITVLASENASDRPYASLVAARHSVKHVVLETTLSALLDSMLPFTVRTLRSFDGMTLRNCIVVALALHKAKELGASVVVTGDGADELLGGYSYSWGTADPEWTTKRNALAVSMNFSTPVMAEALGMTAASPYTEASFIAWALSSTRKKDCVADDMPIELAPHTDRVPHVVGKVCLRNAFPSSGAAFRRKDPIEVGGGTSDLRLTNYFDSHFSDAEFELKKESMLLEDRVVVRDKEHLFYYQAFRKAFPEGLSDGPRWGSDPCRSCGYQIQSLSETFCHVCGEWPAR